MFVPDVPVACRPRGGFAGCGRPARAELVRCDGPPVLCVLVGTPQGRWHDQFTLMRRGGGEAARMLCAANGVRDHSEVAVDTPVTLVWQCDACLAFCSWHGW